VAVCCGHGNEPSGSIKYWEFLDWLGNLAFKEELYFMQCFATAVGHVRLAPGISPYRINRLVLSA